MNKKYLISILTLFLMIVTLITGCLSNSLGSNISEPEATGDYLAMSEIKEQNEVVNKINAPIMQIPLIQSVEVSLVYSNSAVISWETDIESDGYIEYGNNELYGMSSYVSTSMAKQHRMQLQDLQPATTYYFRIISSQYSLEGTKSYSQGYKFTTK